MSEPYQPQFAGPPPEPSRWVPTSPYASWGKRVGSYLVDSLVAVPALLVAFVGISITAAGQGTPDVDTVTGTLTYPDSSGLLTAVGVALMIVGYAASIGLVVWNTLFRQGRTGWSLGKQALGVRLLSEHTGEPIGAVRCLVRQIAHILDALPCYLGYLWPLWDPRGQTYADKVMSTVVVEQPKPRGESRLF